jgi:hypothetical protein
VVWQGHSSADTTWGEVGRIQTAYPKVQLVGQLFLGGEGNVVDAFVEKVYHQRKMATNKE